MATHKGQEGIWQLRSSSMGWIPCGPEYEGFCLLLKETSNHRFVPDHIQEDAQPVVSFPMNPGYDPEYDDPSIQSRRSPI